MPSSPLFHNSLNSTIRCSTSYFPVPKGRSNGSHRYAKSTASHLKYWNSEILSFISSNKKHDTIIRRNVSTKDFERQLEMSQRRKSARFTETKTLKYMNILLNGKVCAWLEWKRFGAKAGNWNGFYFQFDSTARHNWKLISLWLKNSPHISEEKSLTKPSNHL